MKKPGVGIKYILIILLTTVLIIAAQLIYVSLSAATTLVLEIPGGITPAGITAPSQEEIFDRKTVYAAIVSPEPEEQAFPYLPETSFAMAQNDKDKVARFIHQLARGEIEVSYKSKNGLVYNNSKAEKMVALTFDDGPSAAMTDKYLAVLKEYDVPATFYVLGRYVLSHQEQAKNIAAAGCELGSHSWFHFKLTTLDEEALQDDFTKTNQAFLDVLGEAPLTFRPPYGAYNDKVLSCAASFAMQPVLWTVDPADWKTDSSDKIYNNIISHTKNGYIILLHENRKATLQALPQIITGLRNEGFKFVTVSRLLTSGQDIQLADASWGETLDNQN